MKIKVSIIGTGNIGTDLLLKLLQKDYVELVSFVGRRESSDGIRIAKEKKVPTYVNGIQHYIDNPSSCDIVYDCTNAIDAVSHYEIFKKQGIKVIDLTPAKIGEMCVPIINGDVINDIDNVNMITCGGQASIPILNLVAEYCTNLQYIEVVSQIASNSAGMATRINIDNYINTTELAIKKFTNTPKCKVILNLNPAEPCVDMQTTMFIKTDEIDFEGFIGELGNRLGDIKSYVPYYELIVPPIMNEDGHLIMSIKVKGTGDYLPKYAGNLDIINCAAIKITEQFYKNRYE